MHKSSSFPASTQVHRLLKNLVLTKGLIPRRSRHSKCQLKATGAKDCHQLTGFSSGKPLSCQTTLLLTSLLLTLGTSRSQSQHVRISESLYLWKKQNKRLREIGKQVRNSSTTQYSKHPFPGILFCT